MWRSSLLVLFAFGSCISLVGCGGGAAEGEQAASEASEGAGIKEVSLDKLKPLGDPCRS